MLEPVSVIRFFESNRVARFVPRLLWRLLVRKDLDCPLKDHVTDRVLSEDATQDYISQVIRTARPAMVARFGNVELNVLINYYVRRETNAFRMFNRYFNHRNVPFWTQRNSFRLSDNAGFFPLEPSAIDAYCELMLDCMTDVDFLASWAEGENIFSNHMSDVSIGDLNSINPFLARNPWSTELAGKRVVVVHPFAESIRRQYDEKRVDLFANASVLPLFDLLTVKAVQSIAGNRPDFATWFDALHFMKTQLTELDFDVAIIGCGAYGFPLASHVKRMGKVAIHMGGATQLLFGIKGRRWEESPEFKLLFNEAWVRPLPSEVPQNHLTVEGGCYW